MATRLMFVLCAFLASCDASPPSSAVDAESSDVGACPPTSNLTTPCGDDPYREDKDAILALMEERSGSFTRTVGVAVTVNDRRRDACAFVFFEPDVDTFVHEVGHHLGFAHHGFGNPVPDANPAYHDADDQQCMMSYSAAPQVFCGLCQLRMRGWARRVLSNNDATNTRT